MVERWPSAPMSERLGARIWWLEDDRELCRLLAGRLRRCGWHLAVFHRPEALRAALEHQEPDLLLLDRRVPGGDGLDLLAELRDGHHHFPVLILSGLGAPDQRIEGLAGGANDYLVKPFRFQELMWRIERLLQTAPPRPIEPALPQGTLAVGPLTLDAGGGGLHNAAGEAQRLSRGDRALLLAFLQAPGAVLSRGQLLRASGSLVNVATSRSLDVRLSRLRRHLRRLSTGAVSVEAVRGQGYRLTFPRALASAGRDPTAAG